MYMILERNFLNLFFHSEEIGDILLYTFYLTTTDFVITVLLSDVATKSHVIRIYLCKSQAMLITWALAFFQVPIITKEALILSLFLDSVNYLYLLHGEKWIYTILHSVLEDPVVTPA